MNFSSFLYMPILCHFTPFQGADFKHCLNTYIKPFKCSLKPQIATFSYFILSEYTHITNKAHNKCLNPLCAPLRLFIALIYPFYVLYPLNRLKLRTDNVISYASITRNYTFGLSWMFFRFRLIFQYINPLQPNIAHS